MTHLTVVIVGVSSWQNRQVEDNSVNTPQNPQFEGRSLRNPKPDNELWQYLQKQGPLNSEDLAHQISEQALEILSHHIRGMLGTLPSEQFGVQIVTGRESLAQLLTGAMMTGYYLRTQEQKLQLEHAIELPDSDGSLKSDRN